MAPWWALSSPPTWTPETRCPSAITGGDPGSAFAIDPATGEITVFDSTQLDFETTRSSI